MVRASRETSALLIVPRADDTFDDLAIEIEILRKCNHENIVKYHGSWLKGKELFVRIAAFLSLPPVFLATYFLLIVTRFSFLSLTLTHTHTLFLTHARRLPWSCAQVARC